MTHSFNAQDFPAHARLRLLLKPVTLGNDNSKQPALFRMSQLDEQQLYVNGRTPCGKMGVDADRPGFISITDENLVLMGEQGVRCSRQSGESTPEAYRLNEPELEGQAYIYRMARGLSL